MPNLTPGQIVDTLARNEPNRLVATTESEQVDFKLGPYLLAENHQKWELAKDVAAFANKRGGVIVVGVKCRNPLNEIIETAEEIRPVRKALVDLQQHRSIIDTWIFPRPEGVDLRWYPPQVNEDLGLLLIEIPPQREGNMPFIVRDMREPTAGFKGSIGIPRRDAERIVWDTAADIHRQITSASSNPSGGLPIGTAALERARARVAEVEKSQGWEDRPVYFLQALPPDGPDVLQGFYDEVRRNLNNHQILRLAGFAPWQNAAIEISEGALIARRNDILTWLEPDGLVTHALLVAANTYLGWYYNDNRAEGAPLILHPIAVVESTLEFFRFLYSEIRPRADRGRWRYQLLCRRFQSNRVALPAGRPGRDNPWGMLFQAPPVASSDSWERSFDDVSTPGRDAFEALQRFYALFGHAPTAIPLVENNAVSEQELIRLG